MSGHHYVEVADTLTREDLEQPCCEGGCPFLSMACMCVLLGIAAPCTILVLFLGETDLHTFSIIASASLFALSLCFCCSVFVPLCTSAPPAPPRNYPLINAPVVLEGGLQRVYVLVNPKGGLRGATRIFSEIVEPKLKAAGIEVERVTTEYAGHCRDLARTLPLEGYDAILAIGGDGTLHECVNGLLARDDGAQTILGLIPGGSGNSFMTDFDLGKLPEVATDVIVAGYHGSMDAVKVVYGPDEAHSAWSINTVGYCLDHCLGAVNIDGWRCLLGPARYDICALWGLLKGRKGKLQVKCDDTLVFTDSSGFFINNSQHLGNGLRACPPAKLDSGVVEVGDVTGPRGRLIKAMNLMQTGAHWPIISHTQGATVECTLASDKGLINVDGEIMIHTHRTVTCTAVSNAFKMFVPPEVWYEKKYQDL